MTIELLSALWFGILTSISPCPLATNIAAVSFLSNKMSHPRVTFHSSLAYILGRMFAYTVLGAGIIVSLVNIPSTANFLQIYMNKIIGPILLFVGFILLEFIKITIPSFSFSQNKKRKLAESGIGGSFLLGVLFASSFCPISAALFFGSLIPLALNSKIGVIFPCIYGIGTGIPVVIFSFGIAYGVKSFNKWLHNAARVEFVTKRITGIIFILVGLHYIWAHVVLPNIT